MNDNTDAPNRVLREYVTDSSFVLTLSRRHIATLIQIARNGVADVLVRRNEDFLRDRVDDVLRRVAALPCSA